MAVAASETERLRSCLVKLSPHLNRDEIALTGGVAIELARSHGFSARELNVIRRIITTHRALILEAWHEHCG